MNFCINTQELRDRLMTASNMFAFKTGDPIDIPSFHTELRFIPNRIPKAKQNGEQESNKTLAGRPGTIR